MDILIVVVLLLFLGLCIGWAATGRILPELIDVDEKLADEQNKNIEIDSDEFVPVKQIIGSIVGGAAIIEKIGDPETLTKPKLKAALASLTKNDIMVLSNYYSFDINKNVTKPIMIEAFMAQMDIRKKQLKKNG